MISQIGFCGNYKAQWTKHPIPSTVVTVLAVALITLGILSYVQAQPFHSIHSMNGSIAMWSVGAILLLLPCIVASVKPQEKLPPLIWDEEDTTQTSSTKTHANKNEKLINRDMLTVEQVEQFGSQLKDEQYFLFGYQITDCEEEARRNLPKEADKSVVQEKAYEIWKRTKTTDGIQNGDTWVRLKDDGNKQNGYLSKKEFVHYQSYHHKSFTRCILRDGKLVPMSK